MMQEIGGREAPFFMRREVLLPAFIVQDVRRQRASA